MTALRVIGGHQELSGSGQILHSQIDSFLSSASFVVATSTNATPAARVLVAGAGVSLTDDPGSGTLTIDASLSSVFQMIWNDTISGSIDGVNRIFGVTQTPVPASSLMLFYNGVKQRAGASSDFTLLGTTITFVAGNAPRSGSNLDAFYQYLSSSVPSFQMRWNDPMTGLVDGINRTFILAQTPTLSGSLLLFYNGVKQRDGSDFTISGNTVTFVVGNTPRAGSNVDATYQY